MPGNNGSITISVQAEIVGYQKQLNKMRESAKKLDIGTPIAKSITASLDNAQKRIDKFGSDFTRSIKSDEALFKLKDELNAIGLTILKVGESFGKVTW